MRGYRKFGKVLIFYMKSTQVLVGYLDTSKYVSNVHLAKKNSFYSRYDANTA